MGFGVALNGGEPLGVPKEMFAHQCGHPLNPKINPGLALDSFSP